MNEKLFPYQVQGSEWLSKRTVALLADEMGLGKSAQAITACDLSHAERILILCPASARINWLREFQKFSKRSRPWTVISKQDQLPLPHESVVSSYDLATLSSHNWSGNWDCLILDEAHFLKSVDAKRTKAVFGKQGLCRRAKRVWALSGTPAPNHPGELWPLFFTFGITGLGYAQFVERYCTYIDSGHGRQITGTNTSKIPELRSLLNGIMLRRRKEDVMKQLPPIHYTDMVVEPGEVDLEIESSFIQYVFPSDRRAELEATLKLERTLLEATIQKAGTGRDGMKVLEALAPSISTLRRYTGIQKVDGIVELVKFELEAGAYDKIVIFAIHADVIEGFRQGLKDFGPVTLYGKTPAEKRQRNIDKFQNNPKCRVFIGNIQAAGTAITLTAANNVIFAEQDWVPGNNAQAAMRCHRIGQLKPVYVRFVGLADSIDERVTHILRRKTKELSAIFSGEKDFSLQPEMLGATSSE